LPGALSWGDPKRSHDLLLQRPSDRFILTGFWEKEGSIIRVQCSRNGLGNGLGDLGCSASHITLTLCAGGLFRAVDIFGRGYGGDYKVEGEGHQAAWHALQEASRHLAVAAAARARAARPVALRLEDVSALVAAAWAEREDAAGGGDAAGSASSSSSSAPAAAAAGGSLSTPPASYTVVQVSNRGAEVGVPRTMVWAAFEQYWRGTFTGTGVAVQRIIRSSTLQVGKLYHLNAVDGFLLVLEEEK